MPRFGFTGSLGYTPNSSRDLPILTPPNPTNLHGRTWTWVLEDLGTVPPTSMYRTRLRTRRPDSTQPYVPRDDHPSHSQATTSHSTQLPTSPAHQKHEIYLRTTTILPSEHEWRSGGDVDVPLSCPLGKRPPSRPPLRPSHWTTGAACSRQDGQINCSPRCRASDWRTAAATTTTCACCVCD